MLILVVEVVVIIGSEVPARAARVGLSTGLVREPEVGSEPTGLLQSLTEHLVLLDIVV